MLVNLHFFFAHFFFFMDYVGKYDVWNKVLLLLLLLSIYELKLKFNNVLLSTFSRVYADAC